MNSKTFIEKTNLERTALIGFYGGGNYGDELLLETLSTFFSQTGVKQVTVAYQNPDTFRQFHKDYGYTQVSITDYKAFLKLLVQSNNLIIGGGGLWGMDVNRRILLLSLALFVCRWLLGKKVYLLGVGFYNSTGRLGRLSAWFAAKAAHRIFARDQETYTNFRQYTKQVTLDSDIAWHIHTPTIQKLYKADVEQLEKRLTITKKTFLITLRRFQASHKNPFTEVAEATIAAHPTVPFIVMIMEPKSVDPAHYKLMQQWQTKYPNVQIIDFTFNPMALVLFFARHKDQLAYMGPQFHGIITAHLQGIPFLPIAYDNKVSQLITQLKPREPIIAIRTVQATDLHQFIEQHQGG